MSCVFKCDLPLMKAKFLRFTAIKCHVFKFFKWAGLIVIAGMNLFIFGSDFLSSHFSYAPAYQKYFLHVSEEHAVNQSPFEMPLHFAASTAPLMEASSEIPRIAFQNMPAMLSAHTLLLSIISFCSVILFGEKIRRAVFEPYLIYPPPKSNS